MPELQPVDVWVVQGTDLIKSELRWKVRREITKVDGGLATWKYEMLPPSRPASGENTFDVAAQVLQRSNLVFGKLEVTKFPLTPGKQWTYEYETKRAAGGTVRFEMSARVAGWEDIAVPAGTFRAMRIEHDGYWSREADFATEGRSGSVRGRYQVTYWYAPAAKAIVKSTLRDHKPTGGGLWTYFQEELVELSLRRD